MIKVESKVNVYFTHMARHNLIVKYEPQQPMDCWILEDENGKEYKVLHYDLIEEIL